MVTRRVFTMGVSLIAPGLLAAASLGVGSRWLGAAPPLAPDDAEGRERSEEPQEGWRDRHPLITEVLYRVPTFNGDASGDGSRHPTGDEFIENVNPWAEPIELRGYELTDRNPADMGQVRFVFPALELGPGEVAVVFNGLEQRWRGPVGDGRRAPPGTHSAFGGAWVFTMGNESEMTGLGNSGDWVLLRSPAGEPVSCVKWGQTSRPPPIGRDRLEVVPDVRASSVQRDAETGRFGAHPDDGEFRFSPGVWVPHESFDPRRVSP